MTTTHREPGVYPTFDETNLDWSSLNEDDIDWEVVPYVMGPVWDRDPEWTGPRDPNGYILPHFTLGWQALDWVKKNLLADELDENDKQLPFMPTPEQIRFILWFYAVDEDGRFLYREIVMQRLKGHGKDPLATCIAAIEFVGPCRFKGWAMHDMPEIGVSQGDPVGRPHARAWIQVAAVTLEQTQNTMMLFKGLFTDACIKEHMIDLGKEVIHAYGGQRKIQAVTSNPAALEGNRPTLVIKNETHHWQANNQGLAMADAIERNATKAKGGAARTFSITNAYTPTQESVARAEREAYEAQASGAEISTGTMYDTLEAPREARLRPKFPDEQQDALKRGAKEIPADMKERLTRKYLARVLDVCKGDSWWLDIPSLTNSILNPRNLASRSRRFWFNQIVASEDAWVDPAAIKAAISPMAAEARARISGEGVIFGESYFTCGWLVDPTEPVVMFFDGSKSDDSTALVGCRISDGYIFTIGVWERPRGKRGDKWLAPREKVSARVALAFSRMNIVAFWADPSHAKDDSDGSRYWDPYIDMWMQQYRDRLNPSFWSVKGGHRKHAIMFDMSGPEQQKMFIAAAEEFVESIEQLDDIEDYAPAFFHDGHPILMTHMEQAIQNPDPRGWGVSLTKEHRESLRKIDLAVAAVGARMLARIVSNVGIEEEEEEAPGTLWGVGW